MTAPAAPARTTRSTRRRADAATSTPAGGAAVPSIPAPPTPPVHRVPSALLTRRVRVAVIGAGGTGSAVLAGLPYLHQALLAWGHPGGLDVTVFDGDTVSPTNTVRQPFAVTEVGLHKAVVLVSRINLFFGLDWHAVPRHLTDHEDRFDFDVVIGAVDSRAARRTIHRLATVRGHRVTYVLDCGNGAHAGQVILGQPDNPVNRGGSTHSGSRLPTAYERHPALIDPSQQTPDEPSCSAAEALERQEPFVNQVLASHALAMLTRLFRHGLTYHGVFVNLATGRAAPVPVPAYAAVTASPPKRRRTRTASSRTVG